MPQPIYVLDETMIASVKFSVNIELIPEVSQCEYGYAAFAERTTISRNQGCYKRRSEVIRTNGMPLYAD